ncbi:unnamed protein product [Spirodela intermedia]|uniref:Carboxypeptidase n=1 Tax=Spirodela intermedia TaxID=51605 RepID=A0A7I8ID09_SPIIN|nr:unnamed protein product [Spirodela intermedia]CAA6655549.1 unnamed protein product [Spirodela intermedia]
MGDLNLGMAAIVFYCLFLGFPLLPASAVADDVRLPLDVRLPKAQAERLIRELNLFPRDASARTLDTLQDDNEKRIVERRFQFPGLEGTRNGGLGDVAVKDLGHHAGYYRLAHSHDASLSYIFNFFQDVLLFLRVKEQQKRSCRYLADWRPGCSSELAIFYENGPFSIANNMSLLWNDYGWDKISNLLYVDQPTGTGFSFSSDKRDIRHDEKGVSDDLYDFLQVSIFAEHPEYAKNDFYITGESYAGHYIPAFASRIHQGNKVNEGIHINLKGFAIGNGLTDPAIQYQAYTDYALEMGIINQADYKRINKFLPACELAIKLCGIFPLLFSNIRLHSENLYSSQLNRRVRACYASYIVCNTIFSSILRVTGKINYYDIRKQCEGSLCYDFSNMEKFLNQNTVKNALGVGELDFVSCSPTVYEALITDWMKNLEVGIPALLEDGIQLLIYAGEYDLICNWLGNSRWVHSMEWSGQEGFASSSSVPFIVDGAEAGSLKTHGPLSFLKVHDAGHMVPMDQPAASLEMLRRWMQQGQLAGGWASKAASAQELSTAI